MRKFLMLFAALLCTPLIMQAQGGKGNLHGSLIDASTGQAIRKANVILTQGGRFVTASSVNMNGDYQVNGVVPDNYDVSLGIPGRGNVPVTRVDIRDNETTTLNIMVSEDYVCADGMPFPEINTETYKYIKENDFIKVSADPVSVFSSDVDAASYGVVKSFVQTRAKMPPKYITRIEEIINYFDYSYPAGDGSHLLSVCTEFSDCPWNPATHLLQIGLTTRPGDPGKTQKNNLVFLIDVSGSMDDPLKLPLVKTSLKILLDQLSGRDKVAIVVYAGFSGIALASTPVSKKELIIQKIDALYPGGYTAGSAGITLAYEVAAANFITGGNNRVILVTDGDFNVGVTSDAELVDLISSRRNSGIYLTILGFGMGNYQDNKMEELSNAGNGNYYYINDKDEANRFLAQGVKGMLYTLAKDVKFKVEFNPAKVSEYRLIGYENRKLEDQDFADVTKDAGDIGMDHTVTALYEIRLNNTGATGVDQMRYQSSQMRTTDAVNNELACVHISYIDIATSEAGTDSVAVVHDYREWTRASENFRLAACAAMYGMLLNHSKYLLTGDFAKVLTEMQKLKSTDDRQSFIQLILDTIKVKAEQDQRK